jgi:hypothetical protein
MSSKGTKGTTKGTSSTVDKIVKKVRKDLGIPENIPEKYYLLLKDPEPKNQVVFITTDGDGGVLELVKKPGPFVRGERLYKKLSLTEKTSGKPKEVSKVLKQPAAKKTVKKMLPCPPGQYRDPITRRCKKLESANKKSTA